ncbi:MAG TPA: 2-amino-4-hydroxy-6-hydroxymethyldihydropteridine diphosphokinase [Candidatus Nitrosopolaris sp.]|nr:2-amino-4-hydroxy-6-hydroxymethyldihydropteridine diphosphokinase [Candidatus Nitrosopolaris sp.]
MTLAYLGLGSNLGRRDRNLSAARRRLRQKGARILRQSRVIETEPWGDTDQPRFLNQVLEIEWDGSPRSLLRAAKQVEREGGRRPTRRWGPRVIDVDILLFGTQHLAEPGLRIPHPRIAERPFVIEGLEELGAGGAITPGTRPASKQLR